MIHWYVFYWENWDDVPSIRNEWPWMTGWLAAPLPRAAATSFATAPNHEAFRDVDLCFKANVMRLRVWNNGIVLEMASLPSSKGMMLERVEWDILTQQKDTIDHHATKTTTGTSEGDCVRLWVALKDRGNAVAYVTVKTFGKKVYVDLRDYWYPNGLQAGITPTKRGVCLNLEGWPTLVQEMDYRGNVARCQPIPETSASHHRGSSGLFRWGLTTCRAGLIWIMCMISGKWFSTYTGYTNLYGHFCSFKYIVLVVCANCSIWC